MDQKFNTASHNQNMAIIKSRTEPIAIKNAQLWQCMMGTYLCYSYSLKPIAITGDRPVLKCCND